MRIIHYCYAVGRKAGEPSVWQSGNPADMIMTECLRKTYRWDASNDADEVTCPRCVDLIIEQARLALRDRSW